MQDIKISDSIVYIGVGDYDLDLFEGQYTIPDGISYNSYIIFDEKVAVMDTVDARKTDEWIEKLERALAGRGIDYLVVSHMEPDHAANIKYLAERHPELKVVGNAKTFALISQFFDLDLADRKVLVKEGDTLSLGRHTLQFVMAPMVHWPEVMMTYEQSEQVLFSADAFGKFGDMDTGDAWVDEARRYYFNIVGRYGVQVQSVLKKAATLEIQTICPLHGPVLDSNLPFYIDKYDLWSKYEPEDQGVFIAYASIYGNTKAAAYQLKDILAQKGVERIEIADLARSDMSQAVEKAFRYSHLALAGVTYDSGLLPCMEDFLEHLKTKKYQKRRVALVENGSWGPTAAKQMRSILETMKGVDICDPVVTIKSAVQAETVTVMKELADQFWT